MMADLGATETQNIGAADTPPLPASAFGDAQKVALFGLRAPVDIPRARWRELWETEAGGTGRH